LHPPEGGGGVARITLNFRNRGQGSLVTQFVLQASKINPAAVLVDGYNVMFKWMEHPGQRALKRHLAGDLQVNPKSYPKP